MYAGKRLLGLILARGGSKGLPGKNTAMVAGKPLIAWTIEAGLESAHLDRLVVSTDDEAIARAARQAGAEVPFMRPAGLAADDSTSADATLHALKALDEDYDYVVLLQPTSPMRVANDIDAAIEACVDSGAGTCATVAPASESPWRMYTLDAGNRMRPVMTGARIERRQDLPEAFIPTGAVFVAEIGELKRIKTFYDEGTLGVLIPLERSYDIDAPMDLVVVRAIMADRSVEG